ncbi:MAG: hypothetical protein IJF35_02865 [Clostridia bacterium]|nr:hypothetical protein [Oscillospiraceae bacterium]MBQ2746637.1 hypothetical protein [Clostridia bacterium]
MEALKQILIGFSAAAIFIGALTGLYPSGNIQKSVKYAVSLLFLCICVALFTAVQRVKIDIKIPSVEDSTKSVTAAADVQAEYLCKTLLTENGITYKKVAVDTNINEGGSIYINSITVYTDCEEKKVREVLEKTVDGKLVTVIYE